MNSRKKLEYPLDAEYIMKKAKRIRREFKEDGTKRIVKNIAVLGGSTTHEIVKILDLFLLYHGIEANFYQSEFAQYWQDVMFDNEELKTFKPDIIYIHTTNRNIPKYPVLSNSKEEVDFLIEETFGHFQAMWEKIETEYACPVIQNNMEFPFYRLLGNKDVSDHHGRIHFINKINDKFYEFANLHDNFYINDIQYVSSCYGLDQWSDPFFWHMYKYALCLNGIPSLAHNIGRIIKAIYGKNKKSLILDLDNTLWGGIIGDDGVENIEIGQETSMGQVYSEFQGYIKAHKAMGIMLNVSSKNEHDNAIVGLEHVDGILKPEDFILIKANWEPKSMNIVSMANELNILPESMVFVDDNPAEREIVRQQVEGIAIPEIGKPEQYIMALDRSGYFEVTNLSEDDSKRNEMYKANIVRKQAITSYSDYAGYLKSLEMKGKINPFESIYLSRIAQLTNKSNQFNLTTKRYSQSEIETVGNQEDYITLYGKLEDKFGDNGLVSIVIGKIEEATLHIDLWLMSCRVLKREMEFAMMDSLVAQCKSRAITQIKGYYYPTAKNAMVKEFYQLQGFTLEKKDDIGNSVWYYRLEEPYENKNKVIEVE